MQQLQQQHRQFMRFQPDAFMHSGRQASQWAKPGETVLVITDMQAEFKEASDERLLEHVCDLIDHAVALNWTIIVLECVGYGDTHAPILSRLANYGHWFTVKKHDNDGSYAILGALGGELSPKRYVMCGVSINACVRETTCGLAFSCGHPSVDVVTGACGDHYAPRWDEYPEASHLRLIPEV